MELNIRDTLHRISMNKIIIAGQVDFIWLLERVYTCLKRGKERTSQNDTGADLKCSEKYNSKQRSFESRKDSDITNTNFLRKNIAGKRQHKKYNRQHDAAGIVVCTTPGDSLKTRNTLGFSNGYYIGKMGKLENTTACEELNNRDMDAIASSHDEILDDELLEEIGQFEAEITKQLDEARKDLRNQLMINVGYRFLIMNVKLKIANAEEEIGKEKRLEKTLSKCLEINRHDQSEKEVASSERIRNNTGDDDDADDDRVDGVGSTRDDDDWGDDATDEDSEERQEIERLKESILLADCVINMQKSEIKASKKLIQDMCLKIEEMKTELDVVDRNERKGTLSLDDENRGISIDKSLCTGLEKQLIGTFPVVESSPKEAFEGNNWNKISDTDRENSVQYSMDDHNTETSYTVGINKHSIELIDKDTSSCSESNTAIMMKDGLGSTTNRRSDTEIIKNKHINGCVNKSQLIRKSTQDPHRCHPAATECLNVTSDLIAQGYQSFEDNLCEIWLEKLSIVSNLMKIPNEAREEEEAEHVTYYVKDAPRALGRSKRGKCRSWFRQTVYRTKAIAV